MRNLFYITYLIALTSTVPSVSGWAAKTPQAQKVMTGKLYEIGSNRGKLLYNLQLDKTESGQSKKLESRFKYPDGKLAVREEIFFEGGQLKKYVIHHDQTRQKGVMEVKGKDIFFSYTEDGKTKKDDEDLEENFVIAPTLIAFMKKNWSKLVKGDTVKIRFAVLDRLETVGFKLFKTEEVDYQGRKAVVIKMKPSSFIIAALVDPIFFTLDKDSTKLYELTGRTLPKLDAKGEWKDLDAHIIYQHHASR